VLEHNPTINGAGREAAILLEQNRHEQNRHEGVFEVDFIQDGEYVSQMERALEALGCLVIRDRVRPRLRVTAPHI
jgi:hypothetical protein